MASISYDRYLEVHRSWRHNSQDRRLRDQSRGLWCSLPLATVKELITTVEQLETEAAASADATVHVARLATSTGVGGNANAAGAMNAASKTET